MENITVRIFVFLFKISLIIITNKMLWDWVIVNRMVEGLNFNSEINF